MIAAISAVDKDFGIGFKGELLERIPADLKRFKELTTGTIVIMGSRTYVSLGSKPLPNRLNIVINDVILEDNAENVIYMTIEQVFAFLKNCKYLNTDIFIIGGGMAYKTLLPYCEKVYLTHIDKSHDNIDTYFPDISDWHCLESEEIAYYNDIPYQFKTYGK